MKSVIVGLSLFLGLGVAHADQMAPAVLDLTCKSETSSKVIKITSDSSGAIVKVNDHEILKTRQLIAGTEGGPPYLQAVGGGYNITISGGDFQTAFDQGLEIAKGTVTARVNAYDVNENFNAVCTGLISFK